MNALEIRLSGGCGEDEARLVREAAEHLIDAELTAPQRIDAAPPPTPNQKAIPEALHYIMFILSVPSAVLSSWLLLDRIRRREKVDSFLAELRQLSKSKSVRIGIEIADRRLDIEEVSTSDLVEQLERSQERQE